MVASRPEHRLDSIQNLACEDELLGDGLTLEVV